VIEERDAATDAVIATYVHSDVVDDVVQMRRDTDGDENFEDYYFHQDALGNVILVTDSAGQPIERYKYDDFGYPTMYNGDWSQTRPVSAIGNPYLFTGRRWDAETGFYHYRHRDYDPSTGRFLQRDPLGIWGDPLNLGNGTAYVGNNPWSWVDPYGLSAGDWCRSIRDWAYGGMPENFFGHTLYGTIHFATSPLLIGEGTAEAWEGYDQQGHKLGATNRTLLFAADVGDAAGFVGGASAAGIKGFQAANKLRQGLRGVDRAAGIVDDATDAANRVRKAVPDTRTPHECFVADTQVHTGNGTRSIESLRVGDLVLSLDPDTGTTSTFAVVAVHRREDVPLYDLAFENGETIQATAEHPFWVNDAGWTTVKDLRPGMKLLTKDSRFLEVVQAEALDSSATVYNLTVDGWNTYLVGLSGVLVHNKGPAPRSSGAYSHLDDSPSVGAGKDFTAAQKRRIIEENKARNGGNIASDRSGEKLVPSQKSKQGVTPLSNEAQVDHIIPKNPADPNVTPGSNSFSNAQVLSRCENRAKSNR
jgi:RHS repeat-associated protein